MAKSSQSNITSTPADLTTSAATPFPSRTPSTSD